VPETRGSPLLKTSSMINLTRYEQLRRSWRRFLRQGAKVGPSTRRTIAHEDPEAFYGRVLWCADVTISRCTYIPMHLYPDDRTPDEAYASEIRQTKLAV
jgi:hypothetical protein